jgi:hypothetical protein
MCDLFAERSGLAELGISVNAVIVPRQRSELHDVAFGDRPFFSYYLFPNLEFFKVSSHDFSSSIYISLVSTACGQPLALLITKIFPNYNTCNG